MAQTVDQAAGGVGARRGRVDGPRRVLAGEEGLGDGVGLLGLDGGER
jgi:hypothetical protein